MSPLNLLLAAFLLFSCLYSIYVIITAFFGPLRSIPGPFLARLTRFWYLQDVYQGHFERTNIELHRKHGKIVRIAPNEYSIDDPEAAKIIYGPGSHFPKSEWYYGFAHPNLARFTIFSDRNSKRHAVERRKYSAAYSLSTLVTYESFVDDCIGVMDLRFREFADAGMSIDLGHWNQCMAFDLIGEITFSKRFGFLDAGEDIGGIIESLENKLFYSTHIGIYHELHPYIFPLIGWLRGSKATGDDYNVAFATKAIEERKAGRLEKKASSGPSDFVTKFLDFHAEDPERFNQYNILLGCLANVVAGSDTTAVSLNAIMYNIIKYPAVMTKLRSEIDTMAKKGTVSDPVTFKESQNMPYLQAVIKEGLRMHPATGLPLARVVPDGGATIAGKFFPQGTIVGINSWVAHRNTVVYAPDPDTFRPERWIANSPADQQRIAAMDRYYLPFGLGSRTCLGKNISMLEISKLVPQLARKFDLEFADDLKKRVDSGLDVEAYNRWFVKHVGFQVKVKLRESKAG